MTDDPTVLTIDAVSKRVADGVPAIVACEAEGIGAEQLADWWERGDPAGHSPVDAECRDFRAKVSAAEARAESYLVRTIRQASEDDWKAAAWLLERAPSQRWVKPSGTPNQSKGQTLPPSGAAAVDPFAEADQLAVAKRHPAT